MKFQARDFIMVPNKQLQACSTTSVIFNSENLAIYKGPAVYYQPRDFVQIPILARK